ncbi:glucose-1-phosphate cytidylyltransferase [Lachnospiraceae bacterium 29-91]
MKVVILAGGFGTRISEESHLKPKPMIEIGGQPVLWHIMKIYSTYGFHEFIICAGYKQQVIKEYFANYFLHRSDVTFDFSNSGEMTVHSHISEPWKVTVVDTGYTTMTGGRIKRIAPYIGDEAFLLTYGDGVADIRIDEVVKFHKAHKKILTLTTVNPGQRFGVLEVNKENLVTEFHEKRDSDGYLINGGFMVAEPELFHYIDGDQIFLEKEPLERLAEKGELAAYRHEGFWQCMDTQRDKEKLEMMWNTGAAPWKVW